MTDRLSEMFSAQRDFQSRLGYDFEGMDRRERIAFIREMYTATLQELGEALNEVSWKSWASAEFINDDQLVAELIDAWHFIMNMVFAAWPGTTPDDAATLFHAGYMKKIAVNHRRQDAGYDGVSTKCSSCRRALDDAVKFELYDNDAEEYITRCICGNELSRSKVPA